MPKVSLAFFTIGPVYGLIGMVWGAVMGATGDHTMMPAHAHLNLLGLVLCCIMGAFYALANTPSSAKLPWVNFWLTNLGVVVMIPTLAVIIAGNETIVPIVVISLGELATILGLLVFLINVVKLWRKPQV